MPLRKRNNIAMLEILGSGGEVLCVLPEELSGILRRMSSDNMSTLTFYFRNDPNGLVVENCDLQEYEHYIKAWMDGLAYNRGTYDESDEYREFSLAQLTADTSC